MVDTQRTNSGPFFVGGIDLHSTPALLEEMKARLKRVTQGYGPIQDVLDCIEVIEDLEARHGRE